MIEFKMSLSQAIEARHAALGRNVMRAAKECEATIERMRNLEKVYCELERLMPQAAIFEKRISMYHDYDSTIVHVKQEDLPTLREALGKLSVTGKWLDDAETKRVKVSLTAEKVPLLSFVYATTIEEGDPCRIVERTVVHKELLCDVTPSPVASKETALTVKTGGNL